MNFQEVQVEQFAYPTTCYSGIQKVDVGNDETTVMACAIETHGIHISAQQEQLNIKSFPLAFTDITRHAKCVGYSCYTSRNDYYVYEAFVLLLEANGRENPKSSEQQQQDFNNSSSSLNSKQQESSEKTKTNKSETNHQSWLVLRQSSRTETKKQKSTLVEHIVALSFRPLSPILSEIPISNDETLVGIWVGSADDTQVRLYVPSNNDDSSSLTLVNVQVKSTKETQGRNNKRTAFSLSSPVMALAAAVHDDDEFIIAMACQDGTIQIVELLNHHGSSSIVYDQELNTMELSDLILYQALVDGPIVSLCFSHKDSTRRLFVGSLCGFVCQVCQNDDTSWQEPTMVFECHKDDPVMTMSAWNNVVAIGTFSGRVILLQRHEKDYYEKVWHCQLPQPIHGIAHDDGNLVVTTKWDVHLFGRIPSYKYSADVAKQRVLELMQQRNISPTKANENHAERKEEVSDTDDGPAEEINNEIADNETKAAEEEPASVINDDTVIK